MPKGSIMRIIVFMMIALALIAGGCDNKSTDSDKGFPFISVDGYYRMDYYDAITVFVVIFNDGSERFHGSFEASIHLHLPDTTIVYPDTTIYTPGYPPDTIEIASVAVDYPDTTLEIEMSFAYIHLDSSEYASLYEGFDDIIVQHGYYEYIQYGQTQHAYAFERTREPGSIDVSVTLENQYGDRYTYVLTDINGG